MDDLELINLAAKAAGVEYTHNSNPLNDDALALRLAVKLEIQIVFPFMLPQEIMAVRTAGKDNDDFFFQPLGNDPYAATRRAIVRAAAEIGRAMG